MESGFRIIPMPNQNVRASFVRPNGPTRSSASRHSPSPQSTANRPTNVVKSATGARSVVSRFTGASSSG